MPPPISPEIVQQLLPFMRKLALSPRAEQTANVLQGLREMTGAPAVPARLIEGYGAVPAQTMSPWARVMQGVPASGQPLGEGMALFPERGGLSFLLKPRGQGRSLSGSIGPGDTPDAAHVGIMESQGTGRVSVGAGEMPMMNYLMNTASPAQREIPFRGMKLPAAEKAQRVPREPENRMRELASTEPPIPLATKQSAMDRLLDFFRQRGVTKLAFEAEPGERPRLYQSLMGYKAEPQGATKMEELLRHMPARQGGLAEYAGARNDPHDWMRMLDLDSRLSGDYLEQATGMAAQEAVSRGLARKFGNEFGLTPEGIQDIHSWLGGQR